MSDWKKNLTIPNLLSVFRILLIPLFIYLYLEKSPEDFGISAGIVLLISGATDMLDGYIARHFNQITQLGQILDPIADKLTQVLLRRGARPTAALWFGKVATMVFYAVMLIIVFFPSMNDLAITILVAIVAAFMVFALIRYAMLFFQLLKATPKK